MSAVIEARGIVVTRGGRDLIAHVDLDVRAGELLVIVGPNGAGKSTLLGVLSGDTEPSAGTVRVDGVDVSEYSSLELARRRSMLTQEYSVSFTFTVTQVVEMGRNPWQRTERENDDERAVREAMAEMGVTDLGERRYTSLSGGEKARASLARVLAQQTPIVLLDEPTAALDLKHQEAVLRTGHRLAREGAAVVAVLHDLTLAAAFADRVLLLADGRIRAEGTAREVFVAELISSVYEVGVDVFENPVTRDLIVTPQRHLS